VRVRNACVVAAVWSAVGCSFDTGGFPPGAAQDAAAVPDAVAVECASDEPCRTPPTACELPGTCDLARGRCVFGAVDCGASADACNDGACDPATGACVKVPAREGGACGAGTECPAFPDCAFEGDACDETGTRSRTCTDHVCAGGACAAHARGETEACARETDGLGCGIVTCGSFGACTEFSGTCDESGTAYRTCTQPTCVAAACVAVAATEAAACTRGSRDGIECAPDACGMFTECQFSPGNVCDEDGLRVRVCTPFDCLDEACVEGTAFSDASACFRDTDGLVCGSFCPGPPPEPCVPIMCDDGDCG
jgi:hypothetical protein